MQHITARTKVDGRQVLDIDGDTADGMPCDAVLVFMELKLAARNADSVTEAHLIHSLERRV